MPSNTLTRWTSTRAAALDEIETAHRAVGGVGPGRRVATQQINYAYALLLCSQFQGFCRDIHSEGVEHIARTLVAADFRHKFVAQFVEDRRIDRGNPTPGNIGADFNRLGLEFWQVPVAHSPRNSNRRVLLEDLNRWRNAIAHYSFSGIIARGSTAALPLATVQTWRKVCDGLAQSFDVVLHAHLSRLTGSAPW
jgi:hypothetical protein